MNKPLVSIIVPVYKVEKYLKRCVDSLINQDYQNLEIILVDDGSPDNSGAICDEYAKIDSHIKVIHKENGGASSARNAGIEASEGEFITFVDSDDFVSFDYVSYMYGVLVANDCDIVQVEHEEGKKEQISPMSNTIKVSIRKSEECVVGFEYHTSVCCKLYKRCVVEKYKFRNGVIFEDDGIYYKYLYSSKKVAISNKVLYYYFMTDDSVMRNDRINFDFVEIYEERLKFFKDEPYWLAKSYERYAIVLILNYGGAINKKADKDIFKIIYDKYKDIFSYAMRYCSLKYKPVFLAFLLLPDITSRVINLVRRK